MSAPVMVAVTAGLLAIGIPVIAGGNQLVLRQEAAKTADAAALAAADALLGWNDEEPCELAQKVAETSGFSVNECKLGFTDVTVSIRFGIFNTVISARAGSPSWHYD